MSLLDKVESSAQDAQESGQAVDTSVNVDVTGADASASAENAGDDTGHQHGEDFLEALKNEDVYKDGLYFGKYKTMEEAAKGIKELKGKLDQKNVSAPEEYDFSELKIEGYDDAKFDPEHPLAKELLPLMKEKNIPQEAAADMAKAFMAWELSQMPDPDKEIEKLGPQWKEQIQAVADYAKGLPKEDEAVRDAIVNATKTAEGVQMITHFMNKQASVTVPDNADDFSRKSAREWEEEAFAYRDKHSATIDSDKKQQDHYDNLLSKAAQASAKR